MMIDVDREHMQYNLLRTRVLGSATYSDIAKVASRITEFVQSEDVNPVYADTLVNMLNAKALSLIGALEFEGNLTYDVLAVRMITRHVNTTSMAWRSVVERMWA